MSKSQSIQILFFSPETTLPPRNGRPGRLADVSYVPSTELDFVPVPSQIYLSESF